MAIVVGPDQRDNRTASHKPSNHPCNEAVGYEIEPYDGSWVNRKGSPEGLTEIEQRIDDADYRLPLEFEALQWGLVRYLGEFGGSNINCDLPNEVQSANVIAL